jgi:ABC-type branched-subunit amino acid transport system substrate-binding protein
VVWVAGLTGPTQTLAELALASFQAQVEEMNADGGIDGREVVVETADSQGDPTRAVTLLQEKLADGAKPDVVFAGLSSGETLAMLPVLTRAKILSVGQSGSPLLADVKAYPYHFGFTPDTNGVVKASLRDYVEKQGYHSILGLFGQDGYGDGNTGALTAAFEGTGVEVTTERFNPQDIDFAVNWQRAAAANPDVIISDCLGDPCSRLLASRARAGASNIPLIIGSGGVTTGRGPADYATPEDLVNSVMTVPSFMIYQEEADRSPAFAQMFDDVTSSGALKNTLIPAVHIRDAFHAVKLAYEASDTDTVEDLVKQMEDLDVDPSEWVSGWDINFDKTSHFVPPLSSMYLNVPPGPLVDGMFQVGQ